MYLSDTQMYVEVTVTCLDTMVESGDKSTQEMSRFIDNVLLNAIVMIGLTFTDYRAKVTAYATS